MPTLLTFGARNVGRVLARELVGDGWNAAAVARTEEPNRCVRLLSAAADAGDLQRPADRCAHARRTGEGHARAADRRLGAARHAQAGPWAATAFATRALTQAIAAELRTRNVHVALPIVDAVIESEKTADRLKGDPPEKSASMEEIARAIGYLHSQGPRAWTHELQLTPALETWVP